MGHPPWRWTDPPISVSAAHDERRATGSEQSRQAQPMGISNGAKNADGIILTDDDVPILRQRRTGGGPLLPRVRAFHGDVRHTR
jgi:hypothetical protein